jgi:hypothetical protein
MDYDHRGAGRWVTGKHQGVWKSELTNEVLCRRTKNWLVVLIRDYLPVGRTYHVAYRNTSQSSEH